MRKRHCMMMAVGLAGIGLLGVGEAAAQKATAWTGGGGLDTSWFNPLNWDAGVPDLDTSFTINGGGYTAVVDTADAVSSNFTLTAGTLIIESGRTWTITNLVNKDTSEISSGFMMKIEGGTVAGLKMSRLDVNGTLTIRGDGVWAKPNHYCYLNGTMNLGDASSAGHYIPSERIVRAAASSTIRGWGTVRHGGWGDNYFYGKMIADGWGGGVDRELLFQENGIGDGNGWQAKGNTTDKGWYAVNRAKLTLHKLVYKTDVKSVGWGTSEGTNLTMVNSFWLGFETIVSNKNLTASLYATNHSEVPAVAPKAQVAGVWKFTPDPGFTFSGAVTNIFRYDHTAAAGYEEALSLWHYENAKWVDLMGKPGYTVLVNTNAGVKRITVSGYPDTASLNGFFAVGADLAPSRSGTLLLVQ